MKEFLRILLFIPLIFIAAFPFFYLALNSYRTRINGLRAEYHAGSNFSAPILSRIDKNIFFDGKKFPQGIPDNNFSVRWTGWIFSPAEGKYLFIIKNDDGVRLWIDNKLLIDDWKAHGETTNFTEIHMPKGWQPIRVDYFQFESAKTIRLYWAQPGHTIEPIKSHFLLPHSSQG